MVSRDANFVVQRLSPLLAIDAIPAESYPLLRRIVKPSNKNPLISSPPATPTIPQLSAGYIDMISIIH